MKEYRQDSHVVSLVIWSLLCSATAAACFVHSHHLINRMLRTEEILTGILLLILGPAAFTAYLVRARRVWVGLEPGGLVLSGRRPIPWEEIREVKRRRPLLRRSSGPAQTSNFDTGEVLNATAGGCRNVGCLTSLGELFVGVLLIFALAFAVWLVFFVFIPLVIIPVLEVFVPFGDVIRIRTRTRTLVLRDLSDADEFMAKIGERVRVSAE
jgi:hypothetical protein